jgi:hypothetical protein
MRGRAKLLLPRGDAGGVAAGDVAAGVEDVAMRNRSLVQRRLLPMPLKRRINRR